MLTLDHLYNWRDSETKRLLQEYKFQEEDLAYIEGIEMALDILEDPFREKILDGIFNTLKEYKGTKGKMYKEVMKNDT